jgi:hypothetical protein
MKHESSTKQKGTKKWEDIQLNNLKNTNLTKNRGQIQAPEEKAAPAPLVASVTNLSQVIDKLYHLKLYQVHGFGTHNVSGDSTDCIGSCKYN